MSEHIPTDAEGKPTESAECVTDSSSQSFWSPKKVAWIAIGMFCVSFVLPAAVIRHGAEFQTWPGYFCAMNSMFGPFVLHFEGLANFFIFPATRALSGGRFEAARNTALTGLALASNTFLLFFQGVPANEGGVGPYMYLAYPHIGFVLWYGSLLLVALYANSQLKKDLGPNA